MQPEQRYGLNAKKNDAFVYNPIKILGKLMCLYTALFFDVFPLRSRPGSETGTYERELRRIAEAFIFNPYGVAPKLKVSMYKKFAVRTTFL